MKQFNRTILPIVLLLVMMICMISLLIFGLNRSHNAGRSENSESVTDAEFDLSDNTVVMDTTEEKEPELRTVKVEIKKQGDLVEKDEYNGLNLEDNGLPYAIKVNRQENIVTVYELDSQGYYTIPVKVMCCSVSEDDTTPIGLFNTSDRFEWALLIGGVYGQYAYKIYRGILFHSVPYVTNSHSQLETWEYNKLGTGASLGCVRLCVADAKWIYENCPVGTQVEIFDSDYYGPLGKPQPAYVLEDDENPGWDPTDMTAGNPYMTEGQIFGIRDHTIQVGEPFDEMSGVMAFSSDMEDVTSLLMVEGEVDNQIAGDYQLKYTFDDHGQPVTASIVITVEDNEAPVITMAPEDMVITGYNGDTDKLTELIGRYVTAYDGEIQMTMVKDVTAASGRILDGTILIDTSKVEVEPGSYEVYISAIDTSNNSSNKVTVKVQIVD